MINYAQSYRDVECGETVHETISTNDMNYSFSVTTEELLLASINVSTSTLQYASITLSDKSLDVITGFFDVLRYGPISNYSFHVFQN